LKYLLLGVFTSCIFITRLFGQQVNIPELKASANAGDVSAALKLAEVYSLGIDAPERPDSVLFFLKPYIAQGHAEACFILGNLYLRGVGIKKDIGKGMSLLDSAARKSNIQAIRVLLDVYSGSDVDGPFSDPALVAQKNNTALFRLAKTSVELNDPYALWHLGMCYLEAKGTPRNDTLALQYLEASAAWSHANAQLILGDVYFFGNTFKGYDLLLAYQWYQALHQNSKASLVQKANGLEGMMWVDRSFHLIRNQILAATWMWTDWRIEFPVPEVKKKDFERKRY
jgi:uncharacterized protein